MGEEPNVWRVLGAKLDAIAEGVKGLQAQKTADPETRQKIEALEKEVESFKAEADKLKAMAPPGFF